MALKKYRREFFKKKKKNRIKRLKNLGNFIQRSPRLFDLKAKIFKKFKFFFFFLVCLSQRNIIKMSMFDCSDGSSKICSESPGRIILKNLRLALRKSLQPFLFEQILVVSIFLKIKKYP